MKILKNYEKYIGSLVENATNDEAKITNVYLEGNKVIAVIDDEHESEFDCAILNLSNGKEYVRVK